MLLLSGITISTLALFWLLGRGFFCALKWSHPGNTWIFILTGYALTGFFGLTWVLFYPLNRTCLLSIFCFTIALGSYFHNDIFKRELFFTEKNILYIVFVIIGVTLLSIYCTYSWNADQAYDTALYHANSIKWMHDYGTVYGLANLHGRLGVTSTWHIVSSIFNNYLMENRIVWLMPVLSISITIGYFSEALFRSKLRWEKAYILSITPWILYNMKYQLYPNLYFDFPALMLYCIMIYELYKVIKISNGLKYRMAYFISLVAIAFTTKNLSIVIIIFSVFAMPYLLYRHGIFSIKNLVYIFAFPLFLASAWIARNLFITGYPLFPVNILPLSIDWATEEWNIQGVLTAVRGWARWPAAGYEQALQAGIHYWIKPWLLKTYNFQGIVLLWIPLILGAACWMLTLSKEMTKNKIMFFTITSSSVLYWFYMSPDLRFGDAFLAVFFATSVAFTTCDLKINIFLESKQAFIIFIICISFVFIYNYKKNISIKYNRLFNLPPLLSRPVKEHIIKNNDEELLIWIPIKGDQCGNSPLPCTPYPNKHLRLRVPGNIAKGFTVKKSAR